MNIINILCMHGNLSKEFLNTIELITGKQKNIYAVTYNNENIKNIILKYTQIINNYPQNITNIIFFVDIWGGVPFNASYKWINENNIQSEIICGTNIPMLLNIFSNNNINIKFKEIINTTIKMGKKSIKNVLYTNK